MRRGRAGGRAGGAAACWTTRVFSSRYVLTRAPTSFPLSENLSIRNLPYRDELLFIDVFALPKASRIGLVARIFASSPPLPPPPPPSPLPDATYARYCSTFLAVSDLPAPDSPLITIDCDWPPSSPANAAAAVPYTCGGAVPTGAAAYTSIASLP